ASVASFAAVAKSADPGDATRQVPRFKIASRNALLGIVPVLTATPPMEVYPSTTQTDLPSLAPWIAAFCPAGPEPMTTRSKRLMAVRVAEPMPTAGRTDAAPAFVRSGRMCGRFLLTTPARVIAELFAAHAGRFSEMGPRYNIAPSQP